jgi:hypothetical protein
MLFDLRGRGRRRSVQAIYLMLAVLMGGGLVFFGIGGNTSGGLLDAFKNDTQSGADIFKARLKSADKRVRLHPHDAAAWNNLARVRYQAAGAGDGYDQATSSFTEKGKKELIGVARAWDRYLTLDPKKPDASTALLMVQAFGPTGLGDADKAVAAMEVVVDQREPSAGLYGQYAQLAYAAGQTRKGDLAAKKAVSLAPKDQREQVKSALDAAKSAAATAGGGASTGAQTTTIQPSK